MFCKKIKKEVGKLRTEMMIEIHKVRMELGEEVGSIRKEVQQAFDDARKEMDEIKGIVGEEKKSSMPMFDMVYRHICNVSGKPNKTPTLMERLSKMEDFLGVKYTVEKKITKGYTKVKKAKKNK